MQPGEEVAIRPAEALVAGAIGGRVLGMGERLGDVVEGDHERPRSGAAERLELGHERIQVGWAREAEVPARGLRRRSRGGNEREGRAEVGDPLHSEPASQPDLARRTRAARPPGRGRASCVRWYRSSLGAWTYALKPVRRHPAHHALALRRGPTAVRRGPRRSRARRRESAPSRPRAGAASTSAHASAASAPAPRRLMVKRVGTPAGGRVRRPCRPRPSTAPAFRGWPSLGRAGQTAR